MKIGEVCIQPVQLWTASSAVAQSESHFSLVFMRVVALLRILAHLQKSARIGFICSNQRPSARISAKSIGNASEPERWTMVEDQTRPSTHLPLLIWRRFNAVEEGEDRSLFFG